MFSTMPRMGLPNWRQNPTDRRTSSTATASDEGRRVDIVALGNAYIYIYQSLTRTRTHREEKTMKDAHAIHRH